MTLTRFARMCEAFEEQTPTRKCSIVDESLSSFSAIDDVVEILAIEYPINNIGEKKAIKWIARCLGVFESEVIRQKDTWGDLGEGMKAFISETREDSNISLQEFKRYLSMDCSNSQGQTFVDIESLLPTLSALELKWFIRYWLRTPRNGMGGGSNGVLKKALGKYYRRDADIKNWAKFHKMSYIVRCLESDKTPQSTLTIGNGIKPMLAKKMGKTLPFDNYITDIKYDGNRYLIHRKSNSHRSDLEDDILIFNRSGKLVDNGRFQDIVDIVREFDCNDFILDTEIYPVDEHGKPVEHQKMAVRVHSKDFAKAIQRCPVRLVIFDVLVMADYCLVEQPYNDRLSILDENIPQEYRARILSNDLEVAYNFAINGNYEGVMIKNLDAKYEMGKRSKNLLKHKPPRVNLDLVITSAKYGDGKRAGLFGTFGISAKDENGGYVSVGSVGTGFSDADLNRLTVGLKKIVDSYEGDTFHVLPRIVLEVDCDAITTSGNGKLGLRFPRMIRIRDDKVPSECDVYQQMMSELG